MLEKINNTAGELLNSQTNAQDTHNENSDLITREKLEHTPFVIIGNETIGYMLTIGKYKLTEFKETIEQIKEEIEIEKWNITLRMIGAMIHFHDEEILKELTP